MPALCIYVQTVRHERCGLAYIAMRLSCAMNLTFQYIPQRGNRYYIPQRVGLPYLSAKGTTSP